MPVIEKELITELTENLQDFDTIVLATYGFEPGFFEEIILDILQQKDAKRIIVLIDPKHYEDTFTRLKPARYAGVQYLIEPIFTKNIFHDKFIFMTSEEGGRLFLGSTNLTEDAYLKNAELFTSIDYEQAKEKPIILTIFAEMRDYLISLAQKGYIRSSKRKDEIIESLSTGWISKIPRSDDKNREAQIIGNLNKGILIQIKELLRGKEVEKILVLSPFFDSKGEAIIYLTENFSNNVEIYIQPDRVTNFPVNTVKSLRQKGKQISAFGISFKNNPERYIHAKMVCFQTKKGTFCLTGSANTTLDGMLLESSKGNTELCLLRFDEDPKAFDYLIKNTELLCQELDVEKIVPNVEKPEFAGQKPSEIYLEDARLEGSRLIVQFSPVLEEGYKARLTISRIDITPIVFEKLVPDKGQVTANLSDDSIKYCEQSAFVTLNLAKSGSKDIVSNKRWISTQVLERKPRRREINLIEKTHGHFGLITLLNHLDEALDLPTLFYYLQFLDFDWIEASFEPLRRTLMKATFYEEGRDTEIVEPERYSVTPQATLDNILDRHERKFEKLIETISNNEDTEERAKRVFDLFLNINRVIIWFVQRKNTDAEDFTGIIDRMRALVGKQERFWYSKDGLGYFDKVQEIVGREKFLKLFHEIDVIPHLILLSKIIVKLTKGKPKEKRVVWKRQLNRVLRNACAIGNGQTEISDSSSKMEKVFAEYKEYETFSFNLDQTLERAGKRLLKITTKGPCKQCGHETQFRINSDGYLCPSCAKKQLGQSTVGYTLMRCTKCGYLEWKPRAKIKQLTRGPLEFCPKDSMRLGLFRSKLQLDNLSD